MHDYEVKGETKNIARNYVGFKNKTHSQCAKSFTLSENLAYRKYFLVR